MDGQMDGGTDGQQTGGLKAYIGGTFITATIRVQMMYRDTFQSQRSFSLGEVATATPPHPHDSGVFKQCYQLQTVFELKLSDFNGLFFLKKQNIQLLKEMFFPAAAKPHNSTPAYMVILPKKYSIFDSETHFLNCLHDGNQVN